VTNANKKARTSNTSKAIFSAILDLEKPNVGKRNQEDSENKNHSYQDLFIHFF
jgi:hypothetical protein